MSRVAACRALGLGVLLSAGIADLRAEPLASSGASAVVRGTVTDASGAPVPGAEVWVAPPGRETLLSKSDARGAFTVAGVPTGDVLVTVRAPRFDTWNGRLASRAGAYERMDVTLGAAVIVTGRVVDQKGAPVEGLRVRTVLNELLDPYSFVPLMADPTMATRTDADGRYTLDRLKPGRRYVLRYQHPRYVLEERVHPTGAAGATEEVDVKVGEGARIAGTVVDEAGKPVAGAFVSGPPDFIWPSGDVEPETAAASVTTGGVAVVRTDARGGFAFGSVPAGHTTLTVRLRGSFTESVVVQLAEGEARTDVQVKLTRGQGTVSGRVLDPDGRPLAEAWVRLASGVDEAHANTDARGEFHLSSIPFRGEVALGVCLLGFADLVEEGVVVGATDVVLRMKPSARWRGRVTDESDRTIPSLTYEVRRGDGVWHLVRRWGSAGGGSIRQPDEGFECWLPVHRASIVVAAPGYRTVELGPFETSEGVVVEGGNVKLERVR
jgi:protocatechuate 3,4-dioxygenase beta subunit